MAGSTISTTITNQVTLGYGIMSSPLTITKGGSIDYAGGYGVIVATSADGTIVNDGAITGQSDAVYAAGYAVDILNRGTISGQQAGILLNSSIDGPNVVTNSAAISGFFGIEGSFISVTNYGNIDGSGFGIDLSASRIVNSGTIIGQIGAEAHQDTLSNTGLIHGQQTGLYLAGGSALNSGSISGGLGVQIANNAGDGTLTNRGVISGGVIVAGGTLINAAKVTGVTGVALGIGGNASNTGTIYGQSYGVSIRERADGDSFVNSGTIYGKDDGVLISSGYLDNLGSIAGGEAGISMSGGSATNAGVVSSKQQGVELQNVSFSNSGTIYGQVQGILIAGGTATNFGTLSGGLNGASMLGGTFGNYGVLSGARYGVASIGGNVVNYGFISSASDGVMIAHAMLTNAGTIAGTSHAVYGSFLTLAVDPGAVFVGDASNINGVGYLDLQGAGVGSLAGIGSQITGFSNISFSGGADWVLAGNISGLASGETIAGLKRTDTIVLDGFAAAASSFVSGTGLVLSNGLTAETLDLVGSFSSGDLAVTIAGGNTVIRDVPCYAKGTRIATPDGDVAVENLTIGQRVRTLDAGDVAVKWIGWRHYEGAAIEGNTAALPVCIRRHAIAEDVPNRDLWVSPGHAIAIGNALVHAIRLVNGVSVVQAPRIAAVTYYHVELARHHIMIAENCPAESFHDEHFRTQFANAEAHRRLYPGEAAPAVTCLPRLDSGFMLHALQRRLALRAGIADVAVTGALRGYIDQSANGWCVGWAQDIAARTVPVSLDILCGARLAGRVLANVYRADVRAAGYGNGYQGFELEIPPGLGADIEVRRTSDGAKLEPAAPRHRAAA